MEPTPQELAAKHCLLQDFPGIEIESMEVCSYLFSPNVWGVYVRAIMLHRKVKIFCRVYKDGDGYFKVRIEP